MCRLATAAAGQARHHGHDLGVQQRDGRRQRHRQHGLAHPHGGRSVQYRNAPRGRNQHRRRRHRLSDQRCGQDLGHGQRRRVDRYVCLADELQRGAARQLMKPGASTTAISLLPGRMAATGSTLSRATIMARDSGTMYGRPRLPTSWAITASTLATTPSGPC